MKISAKSRYGLRAMVYLARSKKICSVKTIAQDENISFDYLEKIFSKLEKADLVKAKRGAQGGYLLARSPQKITVGEIVRVLEETMAIAPCVAEEKEKKYHCPLRRMCSIRNVWQKTQDTLNSTLDSIILTDLVDKKYEKKE